MRDIIPELKEVSCQIIKQFTGLDGFGIKSSLCGGGRRG